MTIELDHGKRFTYNSFMEFTYLRDRLRCLATVGQMACKSIDMARINLIDLTAQVSETGNITVPPQNVTVIGGGPCGLMTALHCLESCM